MNRLLHSIVVLFSLCLLSCEKASPSIELFTHSVYTPRYASGFEILGAEGLASTLIKVSQPWQGATGEVSMLFIARDEEPLPKGYKGPVLRDSARRVVCMSSSYVSMLDELGAVECVKGVSGINFVSNPWVSAHHDAVADVGFDGNMNYELLVAVSPDLVLLYGVTGASVMEGKLRELNIPYLYVGEYMEQSPLGKAEWLVPLSEVMGNREKGEIVFDAITPRYNALCELAATASSRPKVMVNAPYGDAWFMPPVSSYAVSLIEDAGGDYIYPDNRTNQSVSIERETAYMLASRADVWLDVGRVERYSDLLALCPQFADVPSVKHRLVFSNTRRMTAAGGNDYWESGVVHPDWILSDLIKIFHPELITSDFYYYKPLE